MAIARLVPRNSVQVVAAGDIKSGRVTSAETGVYTVPSGKKALMVTGKSYVETLSGDSSYALALKISGTWVRIGDSVVAKKISTAENIVMAAGTIVGYIGDNGDLTATIDMYAVIKEQDA